VGLDLDDEGTSGNSVTGLLRYRNAVTLGNDVSRLETMNFETTPWGD
jgi:hypothetical protein